MDGDGTGEYNNAMGQPYDLFYQCWLDEVYGRSEAKKFWDHMSTLDGLQDALDVVGFVWDGADVINMVISLCRGEPKEALTYLVCAIPVFGSFLRKGGKWLKSAGMDLAAKGIGKGEDLVSSLRVTYRVTADKVAGMQKYLDDVFEQMAACRMGNGQYRLCFAGGYLDDSSRFMYEIYDDAGETLSRISRVDEMADPKVLKELGGTGHLDDADDILSAAKGLDGTGGEIKVDNYVRVNGGGTPTLSGQWKTVNESMSDFSRAYQKQITGQEGMAWVQNGVKFDGMKDGVLLDAKGKYAQFINLNTGEFYGWYTGQQGLLDEAARQIKASERAKIQCFFAEEEPVMLCKICL